MAESGISDFGAENDEWTFLTVLGKGITFEYIVPSFPVFRANLTEVKLQWVNCEGELEVFDGFARDCAELVDQTLPATLKIPFSNDYAFTIEASEFSRSVPDVSKYQFFEGDTVFVLWNWFWVENPSATPSVISSPHSSPPPPPPDDSSSSSDEIPAITHAVVFKCIGVTKEKKYQDTLKYAKKRLDDDGIKLPVKLQPEPDNKWDSKAIAFMCQDNLGWQRIGYVVREATDEVHRAINNGKILDVSFDWIKYSVHFGTPGYYAGIRITLNGEWSLTVQRSRAKTYTV